MKRIALSICLALAGCADMTTNAPALKELDIFLIAGQSNAVGRGDYRESPDVAEGTGYQWDTSDLRLVEADDPVGDANTGSAWPAFAIRYHALTARKPVLIPMARGGSAQHVSATTAYDNWDTTGHLYPAAAEALEIALTRLAEEGYSPVFRGVLWDQGGRDAQSIDAGKTTRAEYETALSAMIARFRTDFGRDVPFWIIRLGTDAGESPAGWTQVRNVQEEVAARDPLTHIVYSGTIDFFPLYHRDRFHYNQAGLNLIGTGAAEYVVAELFGSE